MRVFWLYFFLIAALPTSAQEAQFERFRCNIVFALDGLAYQSFSAEVEQLAPHLIRKNISLIDLNHWQEGALFQNISGRQRAKLRVLLELPRGINQAVLVNKKGRIMTRHRGSANLIDMLLVCQ